MLTVEGVTGLFGISFTALHLPDFRSGERTFNLLTQVAGRAGQSAVGGDVILQSYQPVRLRSPFLIEPTLKNWERMFHDGGLGGAECLIYVIFFVDKAKFSI